MILQSRAILFCCLLGDRGTTLASSACYYPDTSGGGVGNCVIPSMVRKYELPPKRLSEIERLQYVKHHQGPQLLLAQFECSYLNRNSFMITDSKLEHFVCSITCSCAPLYLFERWIALLLQADQFSLRCR